MGSLRADITLTNNAGRNVQEISEIFIWRDDNVGDGRSDPTFTYYATRVPPDDVEWVEERTFADVAVSRGVTTPHVKFQHRYDDGAEICIARAILALHEAGI